MSEIAADYSGAKDAFAAIERLFAVDERIYDLSNPRTDKQRR